MKLFPICTAEESAQLDKNTIRDFHLNDETLMELAGAKIADKLLSNSYSSLLFLCGPGNNGGDALVVARHFLLARPDSTCFFYLLNPTSNNSLFKKNLARIHVLSAKSNIHFISELNQTDNFDIVIDGLFGTGLNREFDESTKALISTMNKFENTQRISIDIPSGLHASTGNIDSIAFNANVTYSIGAKKLGFYLNDGIKTSGKIEPIEIGFHYDSVPISHFELNKNDFKPKNAARLHKYEQGMVYVIAGSEGLSGAAYLASQAALVAGAPAVQLIYPKGLFPVFDCLLPEVLKSGIGEESDRFFTSTHLETVLEIISNRKGVVILGPGLGRKKETIQFVEKLFLNIDLPLIVDADALLAIDSETKFKSDKVVLTPHLGELSHLTKQEIQNDSQRIELAKKLAFQKNCFVFSKGFYGCLISPETITYFLPHSNEFFRKTGFGDVFSGWMGTQLLLEQDIFTAFALTSFQIFDKTLRYAPQELRPEHLIH